MFQVHEKCGIQILEKDDKKYDNIKYNMII